MYDAVQQEKLYIEYYPKVLGYIKNRIENRSDAEDLASTVFLKVFKSLSGFDDKKSSLSTWIYNITKNTLIDYFRKANTLSVISETEASDDNVEETVLREELFDALASALENMDGLKRDIIVLHYYNEKTLSDIASLMNISYSYVKVLHKKAIGELKMILR